MSGSTGSHRHRAAWLGTALLALAGTLLLVGAVTGSAGGWGPLWAGDDPLLGRIVWEIRVPRSVGAWAAGALLGLAGAVAQGLFRNPLADPYLLGSASGASCAVALFLALAGVAPPTAEWLLRAGMSGAAFAGALVAVLLTLALAGGVQHALRLLLCGVVVGVVLGGCSALVLLRAPEVMQKMQPFALGNTSFLGWQACVQMLLVWAVCLVLGRWLSPVLDGLALGESTALSLGLPLRRMRLWLVAVLALASGTAVAQAGLIAFVGLAAPHLARAAGPGGHAGQLVLASLMGGALLMAADLLARTLVAPQELPVGVLTAVLGGMYLLWLMRRDSAFGGGAA